MSVDHVDCIEKLLKAIEIQLVFIVTPLVGVWPLSTPPMKSRLFLCNILINIRLVKLIPDHHFSCDRYFRIETE